MGVCVDFGTGGGGEGWERGGGGYREVHCLSSF